MQVLDFVMRTYFAQWSRKRIPHYIVPQQKHTFSALCRLSSSAPVYACCCHVMFLDTSYVIRSEQHQTLATGQIGSQDIVRVIKHLLALQIALQLTTLLQQLARCGEAPTSRSPSAVRNAQFCSFPFQLSIITVINGLAHMNFDWISME